MRSVLAVLLSSSAMLAAPAYATEDTATNDAAADSPMNVDSSNEIVVYGRGETRQVQEIGSNAISILTPGTSPLKAIEKLPSVNFQSADPFGNYEWSQRVSIRSFNQNQLGFNFDGIPLGDGSYGNYNGLHISRAVSPENIGSVRVSQGAGSIGTQATNNLGGTIETFSIDPTGDFSAQANGTFGSNGTYRAFLRLNAGTPDGARGYVSYAYGTTDKYRGHGKQDQKMVNAKLIVPVGGAEIDGWFSYSNRAEQDYQDMSMRMINTLGYRWDNTFPDYARAVLYADIANNIDNFNNRTGAPGGDGFSDQTGLPPSNPAAGNVFPDKVLTVDDAYYDAAGLRKDYVGSLGLKAPLGENFTLQVKGYYHRNDGQGLWGTPYTPGPTGAPISIRTTEYSIDRKGVFGKVSGDLGSQNITVGGWYENNDFHQARRFYALESRTKPGRSFRNFQGNPFFTQWEFDFNTKTFEYYVEDKVDIGALKINVGWKGFDVKVQASPLIQSVFPSGSIKSTDWFQPHVGAAYALGEKAELFAGFTQATRAFTGAVTSGPFSTTQAGFNAIKDRLKPETSDTYEAGLRFNSPRFNGTIGTYLVNFKNRLLGVASGPAIVGSPAILQNVGSVRSYGFEAVGDFKVGAGFGLFGSYSYTSSEYQNDVFNGAGALVAAIKGKTVVDTPKHLLRGELSYDNYGFFARVGANYMSKRYYSYLNDVSVPGRVLVDVTLGYHISDKIEIQGNVSNLFDKNYIATVGSAGFGNSGDRQTLLVGAPRQFFITLKAGI